jgi:hypothetical protein
LEVLIPLNFSFLLAKIALAFFTSFPLSRTLPFGSAKVETFSAFPKPFSLLFF